MKSKKQINTEVENTFEVLDTIEEVKVHHFFKHKVLQRLENENVIEPHSLGWFTPQLQLLTLSLVLLMNVSTLFYTYSTQELNSNNRLENFAHEYALQPEIHSILN